MQAYASISYFLVQPESHLKPFDERGQLHPLVSRSRQHTSAPAGTVDEPIPEAEMFSAFLVRNDNMPALLAGWVGGRLLTYGLVFGTLIAGNLECLQRCRSPNSLAGL